MTGSDDDYYPSDYSQSDEVDSYFVDIKLEAYNTITTELPPTPKTWAESQRGECAREWKESAADEINTIKQFNTYKLVPRPKGEKILKGKWVFRLKLNEKGEIAKFKSRWCSKGYEQEKGVNYDEIFAPVAKFATLRLLLSIAAADGLVLMHFDYKNAFLNGKLEEKIYMEQPPGLGRRIGCGFC